ncbi:hypothetical protein B0I37DRAFT_414984 [Chaetomium sp. MPI-CAGE-AT-0009]|nr:hypothetical protein B0I37DRAFT_414984 [Chaetomium sp. MPI-CAGE-AT-0009]
MCLTTFYICPWCGTHCGQSETLSTYGEGNCPDIAEQERVMKAAHFVDWFCSNQVCRYSEESQRQADAADRATLEAQRAAALKDSVELPSPPVSHQGPVADAETDASVDTEMTDVGDDPAPADAPGEGRDDDREATPVPQQQPARWGSEVGTLAPPPYAAHQPNHPAAWERSETAKGGIAQYEANFDPATWRRIKALVSWTAAVAGTLTNNRWQRGEDEVLVLLRECGVPWNYVASFIPRHSINGCETRMVHLRRRLQRERQQE